MEDKIDNLIVTEGDRTLIYPVRKMMFRRLNIIFVAIVLPLAIGETLFLRSLRPLSQTHYLAADLIFLVFNWLIVFSPWLVPLIFIVTYIHAIRILMKRQQPLLALSPAGLELYSGQYCIGPLFWSELSELTAKSSIFRFRNVIIPLQNVTGLENRATGKGAASWRAYVKIATMYRAVGINIPTLSIPVDCLPMSESEFFTRISEARAASAKSAAPDDHTVWPPSPVRR